MCGIAGIIATDRISDSERRAVDHMLDRLRHRGPDDLGRHDEDRVALGHARLSVIDPERGHQPLSNESGSVWVSVNGEFYNFRELGEELRGRGHRFRSGTDAECLPHLYEESGEACVESLDGMFAFALWDARSRTALLARDRLGVKPLYYHVDDRRLVFASELKGILCVPGVSTEIDPTALVDYFTFGFIPAPKTIFKTVRKVPAGHFLTYRNGRLKARRYWDLHFRGWTEQPMETVADELRHQLAEATRRRLVSDVPLGAFLSGGVDSTAVVAAMTQFAGGRVRTLTCGFQEDRFDERRYARETAERLGTNHVDCIARPDANETIDTLAWHFDEPFADPCAAPMYHLSRQGRKRFTVALSGDGGDESLAGYRRYRFDRNENRVRRMVPSLVRRGLFDTLARFYPNRPWMPRALRAASTFRNLAVDAATGHGLSVATMEPGEAIRMLHPDLAATIAGYDPLDHVRDHYNRCDAPDHLSKCQYADIRLGLADGILTKVDRASMAHGLEVRSPMLDHRFVEFAWTIPPRLRIQGSHGKPVLRRAFEHQIGARAAQRPKSGFDVPLDAWFDGPLRSRYQDAVLQADTNSHDWLAAEMPERIWRDHIGGRSRNGATLWKIAMLDAWARRFAGFRKIESHSPPRKPACTPAW